MWHLRAWTIALSLSLALHACGGGTGDVPPKDPPPPGGAPAGAGEPGKASPKQPFQHLRLDLKNKTIEIDAAFCLGECPLELLLCQNTMKDYESMLSSPCEPHDLHMALLALGLKARVRDEKETGKILQEGDPIDVLIRFTRDGKEVTVEPRELILGVETKKHVAGTPFVFFGSFLYPDPQDPKKMLYLADTNDWLIGLLDDLSSVIDLPTGLANKYGSIAIDRSAVPPKGTKATVIIRPAANRKRPDPPKQE